MKLEITPATSAGQIETLRALFTEYADALGVDLCFQGFAEELASLPGRYAPPDGRLLLADQDGTPAGCVALRPLDNGIGEIKRLYVRPAFRGTGLGRRLAERVIAEARAIGYASLHLDTLPEMDAAQGLYASLGFRPCTPYYPTPLAGTVFMVLDLAAAPERPAA